MTDLNKLREEFERLPEIKKALCCCKYNESTTSYAASIPNHEYYELQTRFANGAWYAYQEQQKLLDKAQKDVERIDFLADKDQWIVNVQMPREIVERNLDDLRNAIDEAMDLAAHGEKQ